jgi:hypothetical protein
MIESNTCAEGFVVFLSFVVSISIHVPHDHIDRGITLYKVIVLANTKH